MGYYQDALDSFNNAISSSSDMANRIKDLSQLRNQTKLQGLSGLLSKEEAEALMPTKGEIITEKLTSGLEATTGGISAVLGTIHSYHLLKNAMMKNKPTSNTGKTGDNEVKPNDTNVSSETTPGTEAGTGEVETQQISQDVKTFPSSSTGESNATGLKSGEPVEEGTDIGESTAEIAPELEGTDIGQSLSRATSALDDLQQTSQARTSLNAGDNILDRLKQFNQQLRQSRQPAETTGESTGESTGETVGEDVVKTVGEDVGKTVGKTIGEGTIEGTIESSSLELGLASAGETLGVGLLVGGVVAGITSLGTELYNVFRRHHHHDTDAAQAQTEAQMNKIQNAVPQMGSKTGNVGFGFTSATQQQKGEEELA